jgi:hypothetical protein
MFCSRFTHLVGGVAYMINGQLQLRFCATLARTPVTNVARFFQKDS